jgi:hypothetical protein
MRVQGIADFHLLMDRALAAEGLWEDPDGGTTSQQKHISIVELQR